MSESEATFDDFNSTEIHCEEAAEHSPVLFGAFANYYFGTEKYTVMVIVVICAVLFVELLFHCLHMLTHDSPFNKMISAIEKELMTVGFTAFIFKIIINSSHLIVEKWLEAFELAGAFLVLLAVDSDTSTS